MNIRCDNLPVEHTDTVLGMRASCLFGKNLLLGNPVLIVIHNFSNDICICVLIKIFFYLAIII